MNVLKEFKDHKFGHSLNLLDIHIRSSKLDYSPTAMHCVMLQIIKF